MGGRELLPDPKSKSGLWVKLKKGEHADHVPMAYRKLGTMIGKGSVISYPMGKALKKHGGGLDEIQFQQLGSADVLTALQNGGTDSAWLLDPVWRKVDGDKRYAFLGGQPQGEPLGGLLFGPGLLTKDPDAGVALLRAYIRTVNTYFMRRLQGGQGLRLRTGEAPEDRRGGPEVDSVTPHGLGDPLGHDGPAPGCVRGRGRRRGREGPGGEGGGPQAVWGSGGPQVTPKVRNPDGFRTFGFSSGDRI